MAFKSTVRVNLKNLTKMIEDLPDKTAAQANTKIADEIKDKFLDLVSKGISPIEGKGRFAGYKPNGKRKTYPDTNKIKEEFPSKRRRPVNLFLSGRFLSEFKVKIKRLNILEIGFFLAYGKKLEQGHREGANGQAPRPTIPQEGEEFAKTIKASMIKIYKEAIQEYLKQNK